MLLLAHHKSVITSMFGATHGVPKATSWDHHSGKLSKPPLAAEEETDGTVFSPARYSVGFLTAKHLPRGGCLLSIYSDTSVLTMEIDTGIATPWNSSPQRLLFLVWESRTSVEEHAGRWGCPASQFTLVQQSWCVRKILVTISTSNPELRQKTRFIKLEELATSAVVYTLKPPFHSLDPHAKIYIRVKLQPADNFSVDNAL